MTDYRKRLEDARDYANVVGRTWAHTPISDISALLSEGERMRELVADLERRAGSVASLRAVTRTGPDFHRLQGKEAAYTHAAELARQALGDPDQ